MYRGPYWVAVRQGKEGEYCAIGTPITCGG